MMSHRKLLFTKNISYLFELLNLRNLQFTEIQIYKKKNKFLNPLIYPYSSIILLKFSLCLLFLIVKIFGEIDSMQVYFLQFWFYNN